MMTCRTDPVIARPDCETCRNVATGRGTGVVHFTGYITGQRKSKSCPDCLTAYAQAEYRAAKMRTDHLDRMADEHDRGGHWKLPRPDICHVCKRSQDQDVVAAIGKLTAGLAGGAPVPRGFRKG